MNYHAFAMTAAALILAAHGSAAKDLIDDSWQHASPREEIQPRFNFDARGGRDGGPQLVIESSSSSGMSGDWLQTISIKGGSHYRFAAWRKTEGVAIPRRSAVARIVWQDDKGHSVANDGPTVTSVLKGWKSMAEPEYP